MEHHANITRQRVQAFKGQLRQQVYGPRAPVELEVYSTPERISYQDATQAEYRQAQVGEKLGPAWSTHWFRVNYAIPEDWSGREVHLLWDSCSEACVWVDGEPRQGLTGLHAGGEAIRPEYVLTPQAEGDEAGMIYVEAACNHLFGAGLHGDVGDKTGLLKQAELAVFDRDAWDLLWDYQIIADMAQHLPENSPRAGQALFTANRMVNLIEPSDRSTWPPAAKLAAAFLAKRNGEYQHRVSAIGHAHIDTAWLWPLAESRRKCYRTFSTALRLMEEYPAYKFACSQAQQWVWMKEQHPALYDQMKVRAREGRFVPTGGSWVEFDCNIPSGESLVRQFLYGMRFFEDELGVRCREFWNPDVFGYSGQLPQILAGAGISYFLTQKLSWNQFNKLSSHTFQWEGIDGSRILTHFPPADTYNAMATVEQLVKSVANYKDHARSRTSYMLFGYGDGGGGPTREMLERIQRLDDVGGLPRVQIKSPQEFFEGLDADLKEPTAWVGELYFEYHRGTYTTQAANKRDNRSSELLLRDVEFLAAMALVKDDGAYPTAELSRLWKLLLTNQFHDIIPGSSIAEVYQDSAAEYSDILKSADKLRHTALDHLGPAAGADAKRVQTVNTLGTARAEVVALPIDVESCQTDAEGRPLGVVSAPAMGFSVEAPATSTETPVAVQETGQQLTLENSFVRAVFRADGRLTSLYHKAAEREAVEPGAMANHFVLYDDHPLNYDAWDVDVFHLEKRVDVAGAKTMRVLERGPLRATVEFTYQLSDESSLVQRVSLTATSPRLDFATDVDWQERHRFLKVEFPLNVRAMNAAYEIQFGHLERPTHFNNSWDLARFEVCAHRWADLGEPGFGVALLNDCKYGYAAHGNVLRLSLLRGPTSPDPEADRGAHSFRYALLPHQGSFREAGVVEEGYRFNVPLLLRPSAGEPEESSFLSVDSPSVVLDTVKKAEDSNDLIVRLYEAHGTRGPVRLSSPLPVESVKRCNLLEEDEATLAWADGGVDFEIGPFKIVTLKLALCR